MLKVKIRYLGKSLLQGRPKREFIVIENQKFWNCRRFPEQLPDLYYLRPVEFDKRNKTILDNRHLFVIEFIEDNAQSPTTPETTTPETMGQPSMRTPEFIKLGVTEIDGQLQCPHCYFKTKQTKKMLNHIQVVHS